MPATTHRATEADLLRLPDDGWKRELVDGEIRRVGPAGQRHGQVCVRLVLALGAFVRDRRLGQVFDSSTGFRLLGRDIRSPDVAFVRADRLGAAIGDGFGDDAPDLAIEVVSPSDSPADLLAKIGEYLQAGARLVWVVDPATKSAAAYRSLTDVQVIGLDGDLDGGDVVPGFRSPLREILE